MNLQELTQFVADMNAQADLISKLQTRLSAEETLSDQQAQLIAELNSKLAVALNKPTPTPHWEVLADQIIAAGRTLGKFNIPYAFGGDTFAEGGLDCSGFTKLLYSQIANVTLPRVSGDQSKEGIAIQRNEVRKGDLLFFTYSVRNDGLPTHVGIYAGNNQMIHTNNNTDRIHISTVAWNTVTTIRRVL